MRHPDFVCMKESSLPQNQNDVTKDKIELWVFPKSNHTCIGHLLVENNLDMDVKHIFHRLLFFVNNMKN